MNNSGASVVHRNKCYYINRELSIFAAEDIKKLERRVKATEKKNVDNAGGLP